MTWWRASGRRMNATAANLVERVLPSQSGLRQWVLTFPFPWRRRLAQDGALLGNLTRMFVETVHAFYAERAAREGALGAKTGAVTVVQRTSFDLRLDLDPDVPGDPETNLAASATPPHRTLRGRARGGQGVEAQDRAEGADVSAIGERYDDAEDQGAAEGQCQQAQSAAVSGVRRHGFALHHLTAP